MKGFGNDHIIQGQTVKRANVPLSQKCVASTSASSMAVVALLAIFAGRSHRAGGFKDSAQQARAKELLQSLVADAYQKVGDDEVFCLVFNEAWAPEWP